MRRTLLPGLVTAITVVLIASPAAPVAQTRPRASAPAFAQPPPADTVAQAQTRANALWRTGLALYDRGERAAALDAFRASLALWSDEVRRTFVARMQEGLAAAKGPATPSPTAGAATATRPPSTSSTPPAAVAAGSPGASTTTAAAAAAAVSDEIIAVAPRAPIDLAVDLLTQVREILAPYGSLLHYAGKVDPLVPSLLRVVFASRDGELLELQMGVDAQGVVTVGDVSVVSHGRDTSRLESLLQSYRTP